jgi:hypothetical protein
MNKTQYIKLLELRGINSLEGLSIAKAVEQSGGTPTIKELCLVNQRSMEFYINKYEEELRKNEQLQIVIERLEERDFWLTCLEQAGVDNWQGLDLAYEIKNEYE